MRRLFVIASVIFISGCSGWLTPPEKAEADGFARGADVSWCTEMEADGYKFCDAQGSQTDIFVLMKNLGMTAVRLRVWVDPVSFGYGPWSNKEDVVRKAKRAHAQGLDVMINFHYSDFFADPGRQNTPTAWEAMSQTQLSEAMAAHTKEVLLALKSEGISPSWVQVGNETNSGILMPQGAIDWSKMGAARFTNYTILSNAGYNAVKEVFPAAKVIVHLGGTENADWFFADFKAAGGKFDMIGLSHYPTEDEWDSTDSQATHSNVNAAIWVQEATQKFGVPVMIVETGFDVSKPELGSRVMKDLFLRMGQVSGCAGIFYWEPQTDGRWKPAYYSVTGWNAYPKGAFSPSGSPTVILDAFSGK